MDFERKLNSSEFISIINALKEKISKIKNEARNLKEEEIKILLQNGNYSSDWKKIKLLGKVNLENIRNNIFIGEVIVCENTDNSIFKELSLSCGIYNSTIQDSIIDRNVLIKDVKLLKNYYIGKNVLLLNNGIITSKETPDYGNGIEISAGIETGGREVKSYAELTIDEATIIATNRDKKDILEKYEKFIAEYLEKIKFEKALILDKAKVLNNNEIKDTFIGNSAEVSGTTVIRNATILSNENEVAEINDGAYIIDSIIQWGCEVSSMGIVTGSVLTEHSHVERHGKVTSSIIGPNTGIAEGEVTSSLVGPFVGFHHQSLLIAAIWPEGKGNVGYGANVGSNHTSKAPDQEIFPGEGTFFGLGVNVKFPANFTKAPYSIIATGVTTLPQKMEFPFSLINSSAEVISGISPAYNEIVPAWVLSDNIFTIKRNEGKYIKRNKAKRTKFIFEVFRPEIIELMIEARRRLIEIKEKKDVYLDKDIKGLGKNYMYEKSRIKAIETYTFYIRYYALKGLKTRISALLNKHSSKVSWEMIDKPTEDKRWEHEKSILKKEFPEKNNLKDLLEILFEMEEKIAENVKISKEKDDRRGRKIIDDYDTAHTLAEDDSFVKQTYEELELIRKQIRELQEKVV